MTELENNTHATLEKQFELWKPCIFDYIQVIAEQHHSINLQARPLLFVNICIFVVGIRFSCIFEPLEQNQQHKIKTIIFFVLTYMLLFVFVIYGGIFISAWQNNVSEKDISKLISLC